LGIFAPDASGGKRGVNERPHSVPERAELRARRVGPLDRHLQHPEPERLREYDHLDVEAEPALPDPRKNPACGGAGERLEPALGVGEPRDARKAEPPVEQPAGQLAGERLPDGDDAVRVAAAAHENVRATGLEQKLVDKPQRDAQVGIHEKNHVAAREKHSGFDRMALAACRRVDEDPEPPVLSGRLACHVPGVIGSGLDDDQKLPFFIRENPADFPDRGRQAGRLVPGGNHNAHSRGLIRHTHSDYPKRVFARLSKLPWPEIAILAVAVFLRVWLIEIKPPHFDEGVNGWFADQMTANGYYHYDPTNYHGPLHFYAVFLSQTLFGRHLWALRLPAILASVLCVWALLRFRVYFGSPAARLAGIAMAVSPAFTFYGRYSIHESWQVLFSVLFLWGILGLWKSGDRRSFFTAVFSAAGLVLTKETYLLHLGCFALAGGVLRAWQRVLPSRPAQSLARRLWTKDDALVAGGISFLVVVFFYSGNFLDFPSLRGLYQTFAAWFNTGVDAGGHEKSSYAIGPLNYYWVALMARYEWPALAGLAACARYVWPSDARLRYIAIMAGGVLLAYAIIPYKTPWCIISIIWPFYLILGGILSECAGRWKSRLFLWAPAAPLLAASLISAWELNFISFTDDREPYVYVQTYGGIFTLTDPLLAVAENDPRQFHMSGLVLLDSYYPLPWVLGDFTRIGYYKKDQPPTAWDAGFIAVESARECEVEPHLKHPYYKRRFHLRSAQDECTAYFAVFLFRDFFQTEPEFRPPGH